MQSKIRFNLHSNQVLGFKPLFEKDNKCHIIKFSFITYYMHTIQNKICVYIYLSTIIKICQKNVYSINMSDIVVCLHVTHCYKNTFTIYNILKKVVTFPGKLLPFTYTFYQVPKT